LLNFQGLQASERHELRYRDDNFRDRSGWKEIVVTAAPNVGGVNGSVPSTDQSQQLSNYPTDLLNSPPQELEAVVVFSDGASVSTNRKSRPSSTRTRESTSDPTVSSTSQTRASQPAPATRLE